MFVLSLLKVLRVQVYTYAALEERGGADRAVTLLAVEV